MRAARRRNWCFTLHKTTIEERDSFCDNLLTELEDNAQIRYCICGKEAGEAGETPHIQGYIEFKDGVSMSHAKSVIGDNTVHLEPRRGSAQQASDYCEKEGNFASVGTISQQGRRTDLVKVSESIKDGASFRELVSEFPVECIKFGNGIQRAIHSLSVPYDAPDVRGVWLHGRSGAGKSHAAREFSNRRSLSLFIKAQNKWFDGYDGEDVILIDDMDSDCLGHYLKIWADKYACTAEVKGANVNLQHKYLIVTSNKTIDQLWSDPDMIEAITRRFAVIELDHRDRDMHQDQIESGIVNRHVVTPRMFRRRHNIDIQNNLLGN